MSDALIVDVIVKYGTGNVVSVPFAVDLYHAVALAVLVGRDRRGLRTLKHGVVAEAVYNVGGQHLREGDVGIVGAELLVGDDSAGDTVAEFHGSRLRQEK